jgi:hypothetical protein
MDETNIRIGEWMQKGFDLYQKNFQNLAIAGLLVAVLGSLTLGVLAGPMEAGLILMVLALVDGRESKPQPGDVFKGFSFFLQTFLFMLAWWLAAGAVFLVLMWIPCVGPLIWTAGAIVLGALLMFGLFLIVDRGLPFWPASLASIQRVKQDLLPLLGFGVLTVLIQSCGGLVGGWIPFIGPLLSLAAWALLGPLSCCMVAVAYRDVFDRRTIDVEPVEAAAAPPTQPTTTEPPSSAPQPPGL